MERRHHKVFVRVGFCARFACTFLYVNKGGNKKTLQTIHKPYILLFISLIIRALRMYSLWRKLYTNYTQTIHSNPTLRDKESKSQRVKETKDERTAFLRH